MRIKTNLPKAIVYREPSADGTKPAIYFRPMALESSDDFIKVIYGGGRFVAISENGSIAYSTEGQTWTVRKLGDYTFFDIDYINGTYFIVGGADTKGLILLSTDLINWKAETTEIDPAVIPADIASLQSLQFRGIRSNGREYILIATAIYAKSGTSYYAPCVYAGSDIKALKIVFIKAGASTTNGISRILKGNSRIGLLYQQSSACYILHTSDGSNCEDTRLPSYSPSPRNHAFFYEGYFLQGAHYMPSMTSSSYEKYAHMYRSINLKEWEIMGPGVKHDSDKVDLPYFIGAVRIGSCSLYIGEHMGMLLADGEDMLEKTQADCFNISQSVTINSVVRSDKRIVCVGNGGIIFSANVDINDKDLEIEPSTVNQEIYISRSDNVRMLHVKAVKGGIDPNIKPGNIKKGVTILGVTGTYGG